MAALVLLFYTNFEERVIFIENTIYIGDALNCLKQIPDESVNCCVTSPPYYGLRDYGVDGQLGNENTPEEYISKMVEIFTEVNRVLKKDGTLWLNIGDSYAGSNQGKGTKNLNKKQASNTGTQYMTSVDKPMLAKVKGCKPKDLIGIPWMLAFALRDRGWYLRQDIIWHKANCMVESVKDRCTKSHEYIFLLSKSRKYYYDNDAIKEPAKYPFDKRGERKDSRRGTSMNSMSGSTGEFRNKRDVWTVNTKPYMVGQSYFSHSELHGKSCNDIQDMLMLQKKINWNDFPVYKKRGSCCVKKPTKIITNGGELVVPKWAIDIQIPIFKGEDRKYIEDRITFEE